MLERLFARIVVTPRGLQRDKGTPHAALGLEDPPLSDRAPIDAMMAQLILINRPIVVSPEGMSLCPLSEAVPDLLPPHQAAFSKEDGEHVVDARRNLTRLA